MVIMFHGSRMVSWPFSRRRWEIFVPGTYVPLSPRTFRCDDTRRISHNADFFCTLEESVAYELSYGILIVFNNAVYFTSRRVTVRPDDVISLLSCDTFCLCVRVVGILSLTLFKVALCVMLDRIALADARERASQGLSPRPKEDEIRVLLAAGTNVAVDRLVAVGCLRLAGVVTSPGGLKFRSQKFFRHVAIGFLIKCISGWQAGCT